MQDGVAHGVLRDPACIDGGAGRDGGEVRALRAVRIPIPAAEGVAGLGRLRRRLDRGSGEELRGDVAAAFGVEGQPAAGLDDGVEDVDLFAVCNRFHRVAVGVLPAGHGLRGFDREGHVGRCDAPLLGNGLTADNAAVFLLVHEQEVLDIVELCNDLDLFFRNAGDRAEGDIAAILIDPAEELACAVGRGRLVQRVACFDDLRIDNILAYIEGVGRPAGSAGKDRHYRYVLCRDRWDHADHHYDSEQECK